MTAIHQCPRCELRFPTKTELEDHLAVDHHSEQTVRRPFEPAQTTAATSSPATTETTTR